MYIHPILTQVAPELTADGSGFIYWRGSRIDHWSLYLFDAAQARAAATELARRCLHLEDLGVPVHGSSVVWNWSWFADMEKGDPYIPILRLCPGFWEHPEERFAITWGWAALVFNGQEWVSQVKNLMWTYHAAKARGYDIADAGQKAQMGVCYASSAGIKALLERHQVPPDLLERWKNHELPPVPSYSEVGLEPTAPYSVVMAGNHALSGVFLVHCRTERSARQVFQDWALFAVSEMWFGRTDLRLYGHDRDAPVMQVVRHGEGPFGVRDVRYPESELLDTFVRGAVQ